MKGEIKIEKGLFYRKVPNYGIHTSDIRLASVLILAGGEFDGVELAKPIDKPGVILADSSGKERQETDFKKATEMIRKYGYDLKGIFLPRPRYYVIFKIKGDPDELDKKLLPYEARKLKVDARSLQEQRELLINALKRKEQEVFHER